MYTNLLLFLIVILLFSVYSPPENLKLSGGEISILILFIFSIFYLLLKRLFFRIKRRWENLRSSQKLFPILNETIKKGSFLALLFYIVLLYGLNIKAYLIKEEFIRNSTLLLSLGGILPFIGLLIIVWCCAFKVFRENITSFNLFKYVLSHL